MTKRCAVCGCWLIDHATRRRGRYVIVANSESVCRDCTKKLEAEGKAQTGAEED